MVSILCGTWFCPSLLKLGHSWGYCLLSKLDAVVKPGCFQNHFLFLVGCLPFCSVFWRDCVKCETIFSACKVCHNAYSIKNWKTTWWVSYLCITHLHLLLKIDSLGCVQLMLFSCFLTVDQQWYNFRDIYSNLLKLYLLVWLCSGRTLFFSMPMWRAKSVSKAANAPEYKRIALMIKSNTA